MDMPKDQPQQGPASLPSGSKTLSPDKIALSHEAEAHEAQGSSEPKSEPEPSSPCKNQRNRLITSVTGVLVKQHLARRKKEIVDRYMEIVNQWLEPKIVALETSQQDTDNAGGARGGARGPARSAAGRRKPSDIPVKRVIGQKRQLSDDEQEPEEDEEGVKRDKDRTIKRTRTDEGSPRLACPFFKRDPQRFKNALTCRGHSWGSVSRLKEHLQRSHQRPKFNCKRCKQLFEEESGLEEHQTQETPCKLDRSQTRKDPLDGYDAEQADQLKKRLVGKSVEEKWREIYCILFYLDKETAKLPSPFYTPIDPSEVPTDTESLDRIRQLVPMIQSTIAHHLDRELSSLLQNRRTICAITSKINDEVNTLIRTFGEIPPPPTTPSTPSAANALPASPTFEAEPGDGPTTAEMWDYFDIDGLMAQIDSNTNLVLGGFFPDTGTGAVTNATAYLGEGWSVDATTDESEGFSDMFSGTGSLISGGTSVDASVRHLSPDLLPAATKGKTPVSEEYAVVVE